MSATGTENRQRSHAECIGKDHHYCSLYRHQFKGQQQHTMYYLLSSAEANTTNVPAIAVYSMLVYLFKKCTA